MYFLKMKHVFRHSRKLFQSKGQQFQADARRLVLSRKERSTLREYIDLLFKVEDEIQDLSYEEKKQKRQDVSKPILDAFWSWVEKTSAMYTTNEALTKALVYCKNQKENLETFLEDGRIPLSNNYCEATIKPFATARKAWLFADTTSGAFTNGVLCTLVERTSK